MSSIGPKSINHSGLLSEVAGLNGSGRYGFEFKLLHGNGSRWLRLDISPAMILQLADMMRRCGPDTPPGHVLWHIDRSDAEVPCDQCECKRVPAPEEPRATFGDLSIERVEGAIEFTILLDGWSGNAEPSVKISLAHAAGAHRALGRFLGVAGRE